MTLSMSSTLKDRMKCPGEVYTPSQRKYTGLPEVDYPFHDKDILVTNCGRICMHRKKINISTVMAGQRLGIKEVDDGIWIFSFMHYDLGYIEPTQKAVSNSTRCFCLFAQRPAAAHSQQNLATNSVATGRSIRAGTQANKNLIRPSRFTTKKMLLIHASLVFAVRARM